MMTTKISAGVLRDWGFASQHMSSNEKVEKSLRIFNKLIKFYWSNRGCEQSPAGTDGVASCNRNLSFRSVDQ